MVKPDWNRSPAWAEYLAMDDDGQWYWYECMPELNTGTWVHPEGTQTQPAYPFIASHEETLEARPDA